MTLKVAHAGFGKIAVDPPVPATMGSGHWELSTTVSRHGGVDGGTKLPMDREIPTAADASLCEYPHLYLRMAGLVGSTSIDLDLSPMTNVADVFVFGSRKTVELLSSNK